MSGKNPITILTDQDAAMAKALATTWLNTCHRLCIWHIYENAAIHLSSVFASFTNFSKDFSSCIYDYEEEEDFVNAWKEMLRTYGLETNEWLERLFNIRKTWALVYGRQSFCADLTTTQRSESMNSVLKRYVSYKHNLFQFFRHFDRLVDDCRHEELKADLRSSQSKPVASFPVEILKHAATVYTHEVFELFQEELRKAYDVKIELFGEIGETFEYKITPFRKHRQNTVMYDSFEEQAFEVGTEHSISMDKKEERKMIGVHYNELCGLSNQLVTWASMTMETFGIAKVGLLKMIEEIDETLENGADMRPTLGSKFGMRKNSLDEARKISNETAIKGWKNKEKKPVRSGKQPKSGLEMSILKKKPKHIKISTSNDTIINAANIEQNINGGKNCPDIGASFDSSSYSSLLQLSQQQLNKTQGVERFQWNNSTNESHHEKINEERADVSKG
ncbi:hypothetical protein BUALT_Bualt12G0070400 [Buddleja alternifolia]|uniref:Protein FAR1-RELATED SEQUENCE n=1 Tax=Buddleja alternifolia TaxID=168488 RepID=A0AAV6WP34_9LAMI|nr:hypothetical protein BUALT_Bualt12G0070400 [Buddleja alternifolia]